MEVQKTKKNLKKDIQKLKGISWQLMSHLEHDYLYKQPLIVPIQCLEDHLSFSLGTNLHHSVFSSICKFK